jgi:signal peptidase I
MVFIIREIWDWVKTLAIVVAFSILISIFIVEPYKVSGSSMEPSFNGEILYQSGSTADRVIVFKSFSLMRSTPDYEEVVIIDSRVDRKRTLKDEFLENPFISAIVRNKHDYFYIKRVIGLPGDILEYHNGQVVRNGEILDEGYIREEMRSPFQTVTVPENHVFVMGDNRNFSKDSREIGMIPIENVRGKVIIRYFPFQALGTFF